MSHYNNFFFICDLYQSGSARGKTRAFSSCEALPSSSLAYCVFLRNSSSWVNESQPHFRKGHFLWLNCATQESVRSDVFHIAGAYFYLPIQCRTTTVARHNCLSYNFLPWGPRRNKTVPAYQSALWFKTNLPAESSQSLSMQTMCGCRLASAGST